MEKLYKAKEVREILSISETTYHRRVNEGRLKASYSDGFHKYYTEKDIKEYLRGENK